MIHVRFEGRSFLMPHTHNTTYFDRQAIRNLVADYLEVKPERLQDYVVEATPKGHWIIRPEAVYG